MNMMMKALTAGLALAIAPHGAHAQDPPWVPAMCTATWSGAETWLVVNPTGSHAVGFEVSQYTLISFPAPTGLYSTVPAVPTYTFSATVGTSTGIRTTDSTWKWAGAGLDAVCRKRTWFPGTGFQFDEINVLLGPTHGYAVLIGVSVHDSNEEQCLQDLGCDSGGGEGGGGGGGGTTTYLCYYWDYYDGNGQFLYRQYDYCEQV